MSDFNRKFALLKAKIAKQLFQNSVLFKQSEKKLNEIVKYLNEKKQTLDIPFLRAETEKHVNEMTVQEFLCLDLKQEYEKTLENNTIEQLLAIQKELQLTDSEKRMEKKIVKQLLEKKRNLSVLVENGKVTIVSEIQKRNTKRLIIAIAVILLFCFFLLFFFFWVF